MDWEEAVAKPGRSQDAVSGASVKCGEDGWRDAHLLQSVQESETLLCSLGDGCHM